MTKNIFLLIGPTASGKSNISLQLTRDFPFEVINADLYSVYKGMNIGTAKPNLDEFSSRHYLFNKLDPDMNYNVSEFCLDAIDSIDKVFANNKYPLITGGSMMYIYQLLNGLSYDYNILDSDKKIISYILEKYTYPEIYKSLINEKEISNGKINPNDKYRIEKLVFSDKDLVTLIKNPKNLTSLNLKYKLEKKDLIVIDKILSKNSDTLLEKKSKLIKSDFELLIILKIILKLISNELNISPNLIATTSDLEKLNFKNNKHSRLFKSWRNEVFGEKIKKFFNNELKIVSKENNFFLEKN